VIGDLFFIAFLWAAFSLCAWNLFGAFKDGVVYERSKEYRRTQKPRSFYVVWAASIPLTILLFGLAILMTLGLFGLV
jgi:hypothetical protein